MEVKRNKDCSKIFQIISEIFIAKSKNLWYKGEIMQKHIPLILLVSFFVFLFALVFSVRSVVIPLKIATLTETETEIIVNGKIFQIIERY